MGSNIYSSIDQRHNMIFDALDFEPDEWVTLRVAGVGTYQYCSIKHARKGMKKI
jgi:plastocyanin